jgi:hypothetical protein
MAFDGGTRQPPVYTIGRARARSLINEARLWALLVSTCAGLWKSWQSVERSGDACQDPLITSVRHTAAGEPYGGGRT